MHRLGRSGAPPVDRPSGGWSMQVSRSPGRVAYSRSTSDARRRMEEDIVIGPGRRLVALVCVGPGLLAIGWILLVINAGNGANDAWMVGHYILFLGNVAWVPLVWAMSARLPSNRGQIRRRLPVILALVGSLAIAGQLAIDMVAWALTLDGEALKVFFAAIRSRPIVSLTVHTIGPALLFLGLFMLAARLLRADPAFGAGGRLAALGTIIVLVGALSTFSYLTLTGYVVLLAGFIILARAMVARPPAGTNSPEAIE